MIPGLEITAGQRTMSGLIVDLTGFCTGLHYWSHKLDGISVGTFSFPSNSANESIAYDPRARNNGRSTDNVRTDCGFDRFLHWPALLES